ncbi:HEAT repeat domain-containing protein [Candidatus Palauibacter sp.]|uniref:HEAT repeat domain-containing protein n=1 Tax=Candidatus Palauibacter sp. TaxID=3101350 RepID=UPI003B5ABA18
MNKCKRSLMALGMALIGVAAVDTAVLPGSLSLLGARSLAAQDSTTVAPDSAAVRPPRTYTQEENMFVEARRAISAEDFERAAELFAAIRSGRLQNKRYVADAFYWEAFTRYRQGDLEDARLLLEVLMVGHDEAQRHGRLYADVRNLHLQIRSQLAARGDAGEAEQLLREAEATLDPMTGFDVMPVEVGGEIRHLPVALADVQGLADTLLRTRPDPRDVTRPDRAQPTQSETLTQFTAQVAARSQGQEQEACEDVSVQLAALEALMRFEEVNRMQVLRGVLDRMDECSLKLHEQTVVLIAREETAEAAGLLIGVVEYHPEQSVRIAAISELWRFDSTAAFTRLSTTLAQSDDYRTQVAAINALRRSRYWAGPSGATAIQDQLINTALSTSKEARIRREAIRALGRRTAVKGAILTGIYPNIEIDGLKESLLNALESKISATGDENSATWAFEIAFTRTESADVRGEAFGAWAAAPSVDVPRLAGLFRDSLSEPFMRRHALYAIYQRADSDPNAAPTMMELIRDEQDEEVRERGIYWLGRTGSEEAVDFLLQLLRTPPADTAAHRPGGPRH